MQNFQDRSGESGVSLVDLAAMFIRRRGILFVSFILVTGLGVAYALMQPDQYKYVTLLESAQKADGEYIEKPAATVATIVNRWVPEVTSSYQARNDEKLPFILKSSNPDNTGLIRIESEAAEQYSELVQSTHQSLADQILGRQSQLIERHKASLERQLASVDEVIDSLKSSGNSDSSGPALAAAFQKRVELESALEALKPAQSLVIGRQSIDQSGASSLVIVVLAAILGVMLGIFLVFFVEFAAKVRESMRQESKD
ncbi:hypothetical protein GCM10009113_08030 [Marinobacter szutsaonensis]